MKSLKLHFESLLDDDDIFLNPENDKKNIENWIKKNYNVAGKLTISDDFVVSCTRNVTVKNKSITSLTNGLFGWGEVDGFFDCSHCAIASLEGAPKKVGGNFWCDNCYSLKTLEGASETVSNSFFCSDCISLISLKGAPKEVGGNFYCSCCEKLTSLEGAPKKTGGNFYCFCCKNLKITDSDRKKYKIGN